MPCRYCQTASPAGGSCLRCWPRQSVPVRLPSIRWLFFGKPFFEHHLDEERELFPVVLAHAEKGAEQEQVKTMVKRLTDEHRELETLWKRIESGLKKVAKGRFDEVDTEEVQRLVTQYLAHAEFEEQAFLPLSSTILGRNANHMAALGLSLHMRHSHEPVSTYL
ncbi:hypothetical protein MIZ03_2033 [Rhodoferax lithotrophicus]|uniref:Hemerythrin-like domain-containing protein n=1 Tax=Rhodoferax lithotrophicus TaxID=2798804 RepID=A0ABN6D580_9BURK|nr:hypothetical protein MIZ03_2033 [Rhodoferax sp. MIZ03]